MSKVFEQFTRLLKASVSNLAQSFYDSYVEKNTQLRTKAGYKEFIIRRQLGKCCDWCAGLAGTYEYGNHPSDIFKRHENCRCMVTFKSEKGTYTDVWSKKTFQTQKEARIAREQEIKNEVSLKTKIRERYIQGINNEKNEGIIAQKILNNDFSLKQKHEKYLQHVKDTPQYTNATKGRGRAQSYLTISEDEAQQIIYDYAGTGDIDKIAAKAKSFREFVDISRPIGYYSDGKNWIETNRAMIIYSKAGTHIVPVKKRL